MKLVAAMESMLEVDKLAEKENLANKDSEYSIMINEVKNENKLEEQNTDTSNDTIQQVDEQSTDEVADTDITADNSASEDTEMSSEAFNNLRYTSPSLEGFDQVGNYLAQGAGLIKESLSYLGYLGLTYGPTILSHVYKGVVYIMSKLIKLLFGSIDNLIKYTSRRLNSFANLKKDIEQLNKLLDEVEKSENKDDVSQYKYSNKKVINVLKIANSIDLLRNISSLKTFLQNSINDIDLSIKTELGAINHIIAFSNSNIVKTPTNIMNIKLSGQSFKEGILNGYENTNELLTQYYYKDILPGDIRFILTVPKSGSMNDTEIIDAYNSSSSSLVIDSDSYRDVENIDYMEIDQLRKFLNELDSLCDIAISHNSIFNNIIKSKKNLRYGFRRYFTNIINSKNKISLKDSFLELVYLKVMFIDKVYITSMMDINDYTVRVITNSFSYIKDNIKHY